MKKLVSLILALVLALSLTALADTSKPGNQTHDVKAQYVDNSTEIPVYSVDVSWGAMEFTFTKSGDKTWNAESHTYTDNTKTEWTASGNTVTVTNHSNASVIVTLSVALQDAYKGVTATFSTTSKTLKAGVEGKPDEADSLTSTLTLSGNLPDTVKTLTTIGSITVAIN